MNHLDPRHSVEVRALCGLGLALRNRRMYPAGSAVQQGTLRQALMRLRELPDSELRIDVHPDRLLVSDGGIEEATPLEPTLARRLHQMRVGELRLERSLDQEALVGLIDLLLEDAPPSALGRRLERGEVAGVAARTIDLERIFAESGGRVAPGEALWDRLLLDFSTSRGRADEEAEPAAHDPDVLADLLRWIGDGGDLGPELAGFSRVDLLSIVSEQAALTGAHDSSDSLEALAKAVRSSYEAFDPETWLEFLREPLEIEIGHGDDGTRIDLRSVMIDGLSVEQASGLIEYGIQTRGRSAPRLAALFREVFASHSDRHVRQRVRAATADVVSSVEQIDRGEDHRPWVEADYAHTLATPVENAARHRATLRPRFHELNAATVHRSALRVAISMLARERDVESHSVTAAFVCERLADLVEAGEARLAEEAVGTLRRHAEDSSLPAALRAEATEHLAALPSSDFLQRVVDSLTGASGADFEVACRILDHLQVDLVPHLLALVAEGCATSRHEVARLWRESPALPVARIERRIRAAEGRAARALTLLAAELGRPETLPALEAGLTHEDRETRRAAVAGLGRLPDEIALDPLLEALGDPALEVRVAAVRGLRRRDAAGCTERIEQTLALGNLTGRNNRRIVAALKAAEALVERSVLPRVRQLARAPFFFRGRRRVVTASAARVLRALEAASTSESRHPTPAAPVRKAA